MSDPIVSAHGLSSSAADSDVPEWCKRLNDFVNPGSISFELNYEASKTHHHMPMLAHIKMLGFCTLCNKFARSIPRHHRRHHNGKPKAEPLILLANITYRFDGDESNVAREEKG